MKQDIIHSLKKSLADSYALYLKTQNYHWNVEGPNFRNLHLMFEEQYKDLADAVDTLAELIRGLGEKAPATFEFYMKHTSIKHGNEELSSEKMLQDLIHDQGVIEQTLHETLKIAQKFEDEVVGDFMIQRLTQHRKTKWMLKSSL